MKAICLLGATALLVLAPAEAGAGERAVGGGARITLPSQGNLFSWERGRGFHGRHGFGGFIVVERPFDYAQDREVVVPLRQAQDDRIEEVPPAPPPPAPRKPYVIGASYDSLPGGCMKMIEDGASFYYCGGGEWYRPVGKLYRAVRAP